MSYELKTLFEALAEAGWFALAITTTALFAALLDAPLCEASSPRHAYAIAFSDTAPSGHFYYNYLLPRSVHIRKLITAT